jgi:hypothetical protein
MTDQKGGIYEGTLMLRRKQGCNWLPGYFRAGNTTEISLAGPSPTTVDLPNMELEEFSGYAHGESRGSSTTVAPDNTFTATIDDPTGKMKAILQNSELEQKEIAAGTQVDLEREAPAEGEFVKFPLYHKGISNLVVVRKNGDDAATWVTATAYAVGDYVVPDPSNGHFYKATIAGTSDTPPTWPIDGSSVVDGTVTWKDMGTIEADDTVDYILSSSSFGAYKVREDSRFEYGETLLNSYEYAANNFDQTKPNTEFDIYCCVQFFGINRFNQEKLARQWHYCHVIGTGAEVFGTAGAMTWTATFTIKNPPSDHPDLPPDHDGEKQIELDWEETC